tara:strand:- start:297 stop:479 length:183 start_codon:yes stop_codon:yes gene_type:complete
MKIKRAFQLKQVKISNLTTDKLKKYNSTDTKKLVPTKEVYSDFFKLKLLIDEQDKLLDIE